MSLTLSIVTDKNCSEIIIVGSALSELDFEELHNLVDLEIENKQPNLILNILITGSL